MGPGETIALVAIVGGLIAVTILLGTIFKRIMSYKEKQLALTADRRPDLLASARGEGLLSAADEAYLARRPPAKL